MIAQRAADDCGSGGRRPAPSHLRADQLEEHLGVEVVAHAVHAEDECFERAGDGRQDGPLAFEHPRHEASERHHERGQHHEIEGNL